MTPLYQRGGGGAIGTMLNLHCTLIKEAFSKTVLVWWFYKDAAILLRFLNYLPFKKGVILHLNRYEFFLYKYALYDEWFWERSNKCLKFTD